MGEKTDKLSGNVKEKVGQATGNESLEAEGKTEKAKGHVKGAANDVRDAVTS